MNIVAVLSQVPQVQWHEPIQTSMYTLYRGVYKNVQFYCYTLDGQDHLGKVGRDAYLGEKVVSNPIKDLEALVR